MPAIDIERLIAPSWMRKSAFVPLTSLMFLATCASARGPEPPPITSDPAFTVHLLDGTTTVGRVTAFGPGGGLILASDGKTPLEIAPTKILKITREGGTTLQGADAPFLIFPDGDRLLKVSVGSVVDNTLDVTSNSLGKLKVPIDSVLGIVLAPPPRREALDALWDDVRAVPRTSELVWMNNGDRRAGGFLAFDDRNLKFQIDSKPIEIQRSGIVAIGFDPALVNYKRPQSPYLEILLDEGSRLGLTNYQLERGELTGKTRFEQPIRVPMSKVIEIHARSDSFEFLSEREASAVQYVPYFGATRPYRLDRTVDGSRFQLSGRVYDRGIGTQSRTLLAYKLKPGDHRFQATVGLDDRAGSLGSVAFRVLVDGKERFASSSLTVREAPKFIDVDLQGAKNLILITEFGDRGDVQDLADWVDARILR